jgi:acetyl-CoA carboxylase carboxyltransferase component
MGGEAKLAERRARGRLNARERVGLLVDAGSWQETGIFAVSHLPAPARLPEEITSGYAYNTATGPAGFDGGTARGGTK